jgi:hypothetical protein
MVNEVSGSSWAIYDASVDSCCLCSWRLNGIEPQYLTDIICEDCYPLCANMGRSRNPSILAMVPYASHSTSWPPSPRMTPSESRSPVSSQSSTPYGTPASSIASQSSTSRERPMYPSTHYRCSASQGAVRIPTEANQNSASNSRSSTPPPAYVRHADPLYSYPYERPTRQRPPPGPFDPLYQYPHDRPGRTATTVDNDVVAANQAFPTNYPTSPPLPTNPFYPPPGCHTGGQAFVNDYPHMPPAFPYPSHPLPPPPFQHPNLHHDFPQVTLADTRRLVICEDRQCQIPKWKTPDLAYPFEGSPFHVPLPQAGPFSVGSDVVGDCGGSCQW